LNIAQYGNAQHVEKMMGTFRTVSRVEDLAGTDAISVMSELDESVVVSDHRFEQRCEQKLYESRGVSCYQSFVDCLYFSTVYRYFYSPFNRSKASQDNKSVIAPNPAKFTCACGDDSVLEKSLPRAIYEGIDENIAVTKWRGEGMDLGIAVEGLIRASGCSVNAKE
jgi:hypothetical protein